MNDTAEWIQSTIKKTLQPKRIEVIDLSHQHRHHRQAPAGQGHYHLIISADAFSTANRITQHRVIYDLLSEAMQTRIHALKITVTQDH